MHFRVISPAGEYMMGTDYESCIPYEYLASAERAGYKFTIDDKFMTAKQLYARKASLDKAEGIKPAVLTDTVKPSGIRCINTGKLYKNQSAAAKDLGLDPAVVSDSIKLGRPRSGYQFEKVYD